MSMITSKAEKRKTGTLNLKHLRIDWGRFRQPGFPQPVPTVNLVLDIFGYRVVWHFAVKWIKISKSSEKNIVTPLSGLQFTQTEAHIGGLHQQSCRIKTIGT